MAEVLGRRAAAGEDEYDGPANDEVAVKESEAIEAIKEDICKWLRAIMNVPVKGSTFLSCLDNGVLLCRLAERIQEHARGRGESGIPYQPLKCNTKAVAGSFQARDNTSNFIEWCRGVGVPEAVLFESSGLVDHSDEKRVVLCLLDVGRIASRLGLTPPDLVRMEKEIEELDYHPTSTSGKTKPSGLSDKVQSLCMLVHSLIHSAGVRNIEELQVFHTSTQCH